MGGHHGAVLQFHIREETLVALDHLHQTGERFDEQVLRRLSPLGWEHINLTGDYVWSSDIIRGPDGLRPLILQP